ncbi:XopX family type III secretion system effector [Xanthomonas axonopodis pv. fascicularis]|uniref:XopX family type III secretion system effector n=1 Tax=Xanthomonas axonopodis TaxID=53413 RepID=UPI0035316308
MEIKKASSEGPSSPVVLQNAQERDERTVELQTAAPPSPTPVNPALAALPSRIRSGASSATSAPATITAHANSALAEGVRYASNAVSRATSNLWSISDLRTMLQMHADDPAFLAILHGSDPKRATPHTLASCRQQMEELGELINNAEGLETHQRKQLLGDIQKVIQALQPFDHPTPATSRVLKSISNLINYWPVVVPSPLMGKQAKTFAFTMSTATKGVLAVSTSALRPSADGLPFPFAGGQLGRDANEMHLYNALINALFLTTEVPKKFGDQALRKNAEAVSQSVGYAAGISVAFTAIMLTPFLWNSLRKLGSTMLDSTARLGAAAAQAAGLNNQAQQLRARLTPARINQELRLQLQEIRAQLDASCVAFQQARSSFVNQDGGRELTRTVNAQVTHLLETLDACSKRLASVLHLDGEQTASLPRELHNQDLSSKVALMILATAVTGSTIYLIQPDRLGTINLLSDTCIVTAVMAQSAWNKQATRQDAMERFKGMCGGSMVIALALGAEKLSKTFADKSLIESSPNAQFYAGAIMSLMAVTMPGPIARGAELAMNFAGGKLKRLFTGPEGTPLATTAPSSVEEMQERARTTLAYLISLTPEQLDQYEQIAGESMLETIQEARDVAQAGPSSSVTITEIDDTDPHLEAQTGGAPAEGPAREVPSRQSRPGQ